ncbi:MAG: HAMP domain-containing histidine kinase [Lentisphaeraceae bacterium]|nr:HAMP domain-containing histidine kinase [Lentisphaeraceae bacterium]
MSKDKDWYEDRISFLEKENMRTLIALDEINTFESYFTSINENTELADIYNVTCSHFRHFIDFSTVAFMDVKDDMTFSLEFCQGEDSREYIDSIVKENIENHSFAEAIIEKSCKIKRIKNDDRHLVLHCLYSKTKILGMFIGIHKENIIESTTTVAPLLSVLLRKTGHFLSLLKKYRRIHSEVRELQKEVESKNFALDDALHKASFLEMARKQMLANISHEFRTPLNAIIGLLDLMKESENLTSLHRDYISTASSSASIIISLIDDLLFYVKLKSSPKLLNPRPGSLPEVLLTTLQQFEAEAQNKNIEIKLSYDQELNQFLTFDSNLLNLIIHKLTSNAVKFTDEGSVCLKANVLDDGPDRLKVRFEVIDNGIGLNVENLEFLCQPFTQEDTSTTRRFEGLGIGLALASLAIETLGGGLKVESQPGQGATFMFDLLLSKTSLN